MQAIFGSQFFNFDSDGGRILVSHDFWILWALIGPLTLLVSWLYYYIRDWHELAKKLIRALKITLGLAMDIISIDISCW